ncbi:MAG: sigma-E factor negative regulatory protein [Burkholderiales bacterium]|nr:sigma-E factor negative regulatory protein [Burkholderiales bacterium]
MTPASDPSPDDARWAAWSALCDGEAAPAEAQQCFERWRQDDEARERWHRYQWIGDVMRSEDLASEPAHDEEFLQRLRARLAQEPVVLAPVAPPSVAVAATPSRAALAARRARWGAPAAMAAGVMVVSGALLVLRSEEPALAPGATVVAGGGGESPVLAVASPPTAPASAVIDAAPMLRSAEIDRYLSAHRQYVASPNLALPGGVRQVAVTADGR